MTHWNMDNGAKSDSEMIYKILKKSSIIGIPILFIIIMQLSEILCGDIFNIAWGGLSKWCSLSDSSRSIIEMTIFLPLIGMLFFGATGIIAWMLISAISMTNDVNKKLLIGMPIWIYLFLLILSLISLFMPLEYAIFFLIIISLVSIAYLKYKEDPTVKKMLDEWVLSPTSQMLHKILESIDIQDITGIAFRENGWENYIIKLKSIKQIAVYIFQKAGKTTFLPNELVKEKEFLLEYYQSNLRPTEYKKLVSYLDTWVTHGGSFEILKTEKI